MAADMAKKSKKNLKKHLAKKQYYRQLTTEHSKSPVLPNTITSSTEKTLPLPDKQPLALPTYSHHKELWRTAIGVFVIIALLAAVIIVDRQAPYLEQLGDWLYGALRLQG
jgi:hypothetical protein